MSVDQRKLTWIGSSLEDLKSFPDDVQDAIGYALNTVQEGGKPLDAFPFSGDKTLKGVMEIKDDHDGNTYRAVYIAKLKARIYVLDCFQKKSKKGISTPKPDIERIRSRLKQAKIKDEELRNEENK